MTSKARGPIKVKTPFGRKFHLIALIHAKAKKLNVKISNKWLENDFTTKQLSGFLSKLYDKKNETT